MYKICTDGGCRGNPGLGAWAMVVFKGYSNLGSKSRTIPHTTNNYCELYAIHEAILWAIKANLPEIEILTDSAYCCNGFNQWMHGWKNKGWRTSTNSPVKNVELWKEIYNNSTKLKVTLTKVKGHSGHEGNELADTLCNIAMDEYELNERF